MTLSNHSAVIFNTSESLKKRKLTNKQAKESNKTTIATKTVRLHEVISSVNIYSVILFNYCYILVKRTVNRTILQEKVETDNKLAELEESEKSLKSDIALAAEEKCRVLNELSSLKDKREEDEELKLKAQQELATLKQQLEDTVNCKHKLETDLENITEALQTMDTEKKHLDDQMRTLEEKLSACQDERIGLEHELEVAREQHEAANEARIRAEQGQVKAQEQLESLRCMMDQEIAALKFQLSSETMKYETELKVRRKNNYSFSIGND